MAKDSKGKGSVEQALIRELAELLDETRLSEIEIEREGLRVRVARQMAVQAMPWRKPRRLPHSGRGGRSGAPQPAAADPAKHPGAVKSPMVGTAYLRARARRCSFHRRGHPRRPGADAVDHRGDEDHEPHPGSEGRRVTAIFIGNGQPVEFGETAGDHRVAVTTGAGGKRCSRRY